MSNKMFQTVEPYLKFKKNPNRGPLSQTRALKQGPLFKLASQTLGPPLLRLKFYFKLNELFSNAKY